jgi:hypothetical protein
VSLEDNSKNYNLVSHILIVALFGITLKR